MATYVVSIHKRRGTDIDVTVNADSEEQARRIAHGLHNGTVNDVVELDEEGYPENSVTISGVTITPPPAPADDDTDIERVPGSGEEQ